jgi:hypothetical protein
MKSLLAALIILFGQSIILIAHPLHISIVNMDVVTDSNVVKYSVRLFYDDFQTLINTRYNTMLDFSKQNRLTLKEQQSILEYINSTFAIKDENLVTLHTVFSGWKVENMSVWFYFCTSFNNKSKSLLIENKLMNDLFMDQKNLLIFRNSNTEEGFEFNQRTIKQHVSIY